LPLDGCACPGKRLSNHIFISRGEVRYLQRISSVSSAVKDC